MNTFRGRRCQTLLALAFAGGCLLLVATGEAGTEPAPTPPPWQQELQAAQLLEGALTLSPAKDPAEQGKRRLQLREMYGQIARKYPDEAAVQKGVGSYHARDGQPEAALPYWEHAAQIDPRDADTASLLGGEFLRLGRTRDAYGQYARAVEAQPENSTYHFDLANVLYLFRQDLLSPPTAGVPDEQSALVLALEHFRRAAQLAPSDVRLAQAYAETFYVFSKPDWTQALAAWETVLVLSGEKGDFANSHLARISLRMNQPKAAVDYLAKIHDPAFDGLKAKLLQQAAKQQAAKR